MPISPGTVIAQKFRLEAPLARGGMGAVWTARHVTLGSQVAVKFLDPKLATSPAFVTRFEREARAAATIQSPHIVQVHDFGLDDGTPYLVMELLRGEDLRSRLRRQGRLSLSVAAGLLMQVGKGLRRAHEAGIVHRDIKPGNLFLARIEDDEVLKILDFGIAKEGDTGLDDHTKTGELVGSPHYVSPEQARGEKDVDHRSDVWSVGVLAFRMVTGHLPFPGDGLGRVLSKVLVEPPPKMGSIDTGLPVSLDAFFDRALAKRKDERFQSVRELVDAFVELVRVAGTDESVPPPSWSTIVSVSMPPGEVGADVLPPPARVPVVGHAEAEAMAPVTRDASPPGGRDAGPEVSVAVAQQDGSAAVAKDSTASVAKPLTAPTGPATSTPVTHGVNMGVAPATSTPVSRGANVPVAPATSTPVAGAPSVAVGAAREQGRSPAQGMAWSEGDSASPALLDEVGPKRDSLMPSMAPKTAPAHPILRFRWAAAAALCLSVVVTVAVAWLRDHGAAPSSSAPGDVVSAPTTPLFAPPAETPATPPRGPKTPPPTGAAPLGSSRFPAPPPNWNDPSTSPSASTSTRVMNAPFPSAPSAYPAGPSATGSPSSSSSAGPKRKWGF